MSWLYSRALVEASLQDTLSDGVACALWSGTPTQQACSWHGKTTDRSPLSRSGTTYQLLTDDRGEALLTSFLAGFRAKISASPVAGPGSTESDRDSGERWRASFARWSPDSCSWKTPQLSLFADSVSSSVIWPRSGTMLNGECWERPPLARLIDASGFGSSLKDVPTPIADDATGSRYYGNGSPKLRGWVDTFPTPCAIDATGGRINRSDSPGAAERPTLARLVTRGDVQPGPVTLSADWVEWLMGWPIGWTDLRGTPTPWDGWHEEPVPRVTPARRPKTRARLRCLGNGQVPQCAAAAWVALRARREAAP